MDVVENAKGSYANKGYFVDVICLFRRHADGVGDFLDIEGLLFEPNPLLILRYFLVFSYVFIQVDSGWLDSPVVDI